MECRASCGEGLGSGAGTESAPLGLVAARNRRSTLLGNIRAVPGRGKGLTDGGGHLAVFTAHPKAGPASEGARESENERTNHHLLLPGFCSPACPHPFLLGGPLCQQLLRTTDSWLPTPSHPQVVCAEVMLSHHTGGDPSGTGGRQEAWPLLESP